VPTGSVEVGRYVLHEAFAAGGMARVHLGQQRTGSGLSRVVAVKRLLPQLASDGTFTRAFLEEAQLTSHITHPNVVPTLDVVNDGRELLIVMELVRGAPLSALRDAAAKHSAELQVPIAVRVVSDLLAGLHAAHEARDAKGAPLQIVHRDVSPQNVLVGLDGVTRVFDFGIARAASRLRTTAEGQVKGKLSYMAPEQMMGGEVDRRADLWAAGVILWELVTGRRMFSASDPSGIARAVLQAPLVRPSVIRKVPAALDDVVMDALARVPAQRFATGEEMRVALERAVAPSTARQVGAWVAELGGEAVAQQAAMISKVEQRSGPRLTNPKVQAITPRPRRKRRRWPFAVAAAGALAGSALAAWVLSQS